MMNIRKNGTPEFSRREALAAAAGATMFWAVAAHAEDTPAGPLPLHTTGLEHIGLTVPDQRASAEWYGRIFDPQLFQEKDPPPRFYVRMGTAYIAFGGTATPDLPARIDHFCALVKDYKGDEMRAAVEKAGISMGTGRLGMPTDSDGIKLQLLGVPGGLARTIIPSTRITTDDAAVAALGLDHIALAVTDVPRATEHYAKFFGPPATKKADQVTFQVVNTRLLLEPVASDAKPEIHRLSFRVAGFDKKGITSKLQKFQVEILPSSGDRSVRFRDPNGFNIELVGESRRA
jgi:catechol 2,3-dioxygenase-like lactoylglutathione lyase family enzyme